MTEKRFTIHKESKYKEEWYAYPFCIKEDGEVVLETIPLSIAEKVRDKLNEQQATINQLKEDNEQLRKYNGQLKERLEKINGGYGLLTHRKGLTANEWLIESQERENKKLNESCVRYGFEVGRLEEENEQLKAKVKRLQDIATRTEVEKEKYGD